MQRVCDVCGKTFTAQRSTAKACSSSCRVKKSTDKARLSALPGASAPVSAVPSAPIADSALVEAVRSELATAGREQSALGQAALVLAARISSGAEPAAAVASLNRELRSTMTEALRTSAASVVGSLRDELAERRARA